MSLDQIAPPEQAPMTGQDSLSTQLQGQFQRWCDGRKPQEEKFLVNYADAMRIPLDGDTKETGLSRAQKSKLFVGSTRGKIRSARAKIKDSLFGSGKMPFDTTPSNEKLKSYADVVEEILTFQFKDMGYRGMMGGGVNSLCTYGTATIFGPFEKQKVHTSADLVDDGFGNMRLAEKKFPYPCPYFEHAPTMDVYNDLEASDAQNGMGTFWSSWKRPDEVRGWAALDGYNAEAIEYACTQLGTNSSGEGSDRTTDERANLYRFSRDGRVRVLRYFGLVRRVDLEAWAPEQGNDQTPMEAAPGAEVEQNDEEMVEAVIIMAGGIVIKANRSPYKDGRRPAHRCVYEEVEHEFYGVGIAENNEPHQRVVNAAFRLYIEGKAFALLKTCSIDKSKFEVGEDFKLYPGKQWLMRTGLTPEERKTAIIWHDMLDVTQGWEGVIDLSERFSDDDTGITKYSQGTDSQHLNNTATGISMIMNASSLPMKEVIQNIDEMWIEKQVESLIDWNFENLTAEAVTTLLGEKQGAKWAEILAFGKTSFMNWKATGSSTFMVKEILMQKLQGFMQLALGNPITASLVDARELLEQVWDSGEIGKESPVYDEETLKQKQGGQQIPPEIQEALAKQEELIKKQEEALASRDADTQIKMAEIASRERLESQRMLIADRDSRVKAEQGLANVELTEAKTDLTQAQTVTALAAAQLAPSEHLLDVATAASDAEQARIETEQVDQQIAMDQAAQQAAQQQQAAEPPMPEASAPPAEGQADE